MRNSAEALAELGQANPPLAWAKRSGEAWSLCRASAWFTLAIHPRGEPRGILAKANKNYGNDKNSLI